MANTLTNIMPKILARGLMSLRERCVMPRLVNGDYASDAARKGTTIDVPIPTAISTRNVTPSNTPPAPVDGAPGLVQVTMSNWKQNDPIFLTDKELVQIDENEHFIPMAVSEAIRSLAADVNTSIHAEAEGVYGYTGTAGTTPFGSSVVDATGARRNLNQQLAPRSDRRGVLNHDAEANALALSAFSDAEKVMSAVVKMEGELGRKFGIDWVADDHVRTHTAGTGTGYLVNNGAGYAIGSTTIAADTGSGTIIVGDIITFAGHSQTYVVTTALSAGSLAIYPGLKAAVADDAAITLKATHVMNLAFHRDAFAFATRPLQGETEGYQLGSNIMTMQDPLTGLVLRLEVSRQHKQVVWEFDILWGAKLVRPELATRIAG